MAHLSRIAAAAALACTCLGASAANFHFTGNLSNANEVVRIGFTLASDATNVQVWTDSFRSGTNFDPIAGLWNLGNGGTLVRENDDNAFVAPGQTWFDSGMVFSTLSAGTYLFTVAAFPNFALGTNISNGFYMDNRAPTALNRGSYYSLHLSGVDTAFEGVPVMQPIPEPETYALMVLGLGLVGFTVRRRKAALNNG